MVDGEDLSAVDPQVDSGFIPKRQPETINSLILSDKFDAVNPEGRILGRVARSSYDGELLSIDPDLALKKILVFALRRHVKNENSGMSRDLLRLQA